MKTRLEILVEVLQDLGEEVTEAISTYWASQTKDSFRVNDIEYTVLSRLEFNDELYVLAEEMSNEFIEEIYDIISEEYRINEIYYSEILSTLNVADCADKILAQIDQLEFEKARNMECIFSDDKFLVFRSYE